MILKEVAHPYSEKPFTKFLDWKENYLDEFTGFVLQKKGKRYIFNAESGFQVFEVEVGKKFIGDRIQLTWNNTLRQRPMTHEEAEDFLDEVNLFLESNFTDPETNDLHLIAHTSFQTLYSQKSSMK